MSYIFYYKEYTVLRGAAMQKIQQLWFLSINLLVNFALNACQPGSLTFVESVPSSATQDLVFTAQPYQGNILAASRNTLSTFVNTNGNLGAPNNLSGVSQSVVFYPAAAPARNYLISTFVSTNTLALYSVAPISGALSLLTSVTTGSLGPRYVGFSPDGGYVAVSTLGQIEMYSITESPAALNFITSIPVSFSISNLVYSPTQNCIAVLSNDDPDWDFIYVFRFDPISSSLTQVAGSPFALSGTRLRTLAYSPDGLFLTAVNLGPTGYIFSVDQTTGALTSTGLTFTFPGSSAGSINNLKYAPNGRFAAAVSGTNNLIYMFSVDQGTGAFTFINSFPSVTTGPTSLAISYDSRVLAVGNQSTSGAISTFLIDPPAPEVTITPNQATVCQGLSFQLQLTAAVTPDTGVAPFTYSWTGPNGYTSTSNPAVLPAPVQLAYSGNYQVTVTDANGCQGIATQLITVNPSPVGNIVPATQTACAGATVNLTAQATGGAPGYTYEWFGPGSISPIATTQILTLTNVQYSQSGAYSVRITDANGCSPAGTLPTAALTVTQAPIVAVSPLSQTACVGNAVTFNSQVTGGVAPYTYTWTGPNGYTSAASSITLPNLQLIDAGSYTLTVSDANGCTSAPQSATLIVNPLPVAVISPTSATICGGTATFTASGGTSYAWTGPNGFTATTPAITVSASGIYEVTVFEDGIGCTDTAQATLTNTGPVITLNPDASVCLGASATFTATVTGGTPPYAYSWSDSSGVISDQLSITLTPTTIGVTTYSFAVTDSNGCTNTADVTLTVNAIPTVVVTASATTINAGESVVLTSTPTAVAPYELRWSDGLIQSGLTGISTRTVSPIVSTQYSVIIADATGCESDPVLAIDITVENSLLLSDLARAILIKYCGFTGL